MHASVSLKTFSFDSAFESRLADMASYGIRNLTLHHKMQTSGQNGKNKFVGYIYDKPANMALNGRMVGDGGCDEEEDEDEDDEDDENDDEDGHGDEDAMAASGDK